MTIGPFQIVIIALILLLLFGRGRIGQSLGDLGEGVKAFRKSFRDEEPPEPLAIEAAEPQGTADK